MFIPLYKNHMKKNSVPGGLFCVLVLLLGACSSAPVVKTADPVPELALISEAPVMTGFRASVLSFSYEIYNPGAETLHVEGVESSLLLDGRVVSSLSDGALVLEGGERKVLPLYFDLIFEELYREFPEFADLPGASWQLRTDCRYRGGDEELLTLSSEEDGEMVLVKLPRFDFESLYVKSLGLMGADIIILMNAENPNPFAVNMDALEGVLRVNDQRWTELASGKSVELPSVSLSQFGFQFRLEFLSMGRTVRDLLSRQEALAYLFDGAMALSSLPVSPEGEELPLVFSGNVEIIHPDTTGGAHSSVKIENSIESNLINIFGRYR